MPKDDQENVCIDTNDGKDWHVGDHGDTYRILHQSDHETVKLWHWYTDFVPGEMTHTGGAEIFVIDGSFQDDEEVYPKGTWLRLPPGYSHRPRTEGGCSLWIKTDHLLDPPPLPPQAKS